MTLNVKPADLEAAAAAVDNAVLALSNIETQSKSAQQDATEIHYEPAAGKADAVAQKALENLTLARHALTGLATGFRAAARTYTSEDHGVATRMAGGH